jgi:hypothetical protein
VERPRSDPERAAVWLDQGEGNHGEDVKECYYYLDNTPTHSYMRMLYKYPQRAFPYDDLVRTNNARSRLDPEYELIDTGVFDDDAYFDVAVEYAKRTPEDLLIRITVTNRGSADAILHLLPHLWFRNTWWLDGIRPSLESRRLGRRAAIDAVHPDLGTYVLACDRDVPLLFTENEPTNDACLGARRIRLRSSRMASTTASSAIARTR